MGKKKKDSLGRALIRDRFSNRQRKATDSMLHTSELDDGYDWGRLNLQSVTEESSFHDFLRTAELAGTEFQAEKLNVKFVESFKALETWTSAEKEDFERICLENKDLIRIPRRPKWDETTSAADLQAAEREVFLAWRRHLSLLQEEKEITLTPYEKNLDFWRQLWRVVERSQLVVQIVDARNPLLFRCEDLELYTKETDAEKECLLLLNKADFLTKSQRSSWAEYFSSQRIRCAFFSATTSLQLQTLPEEEEVLVVPNEHNGTEKNKEEVNEIRTSQTDREEDTKGNEGGIVSDTKKLSLSSGNGEESDCLKSNSETSALTEPPLTGTTDTVICTNGVEPSWEPNSSEILSPSKLLALFMKLASPKDPMNGKNGKRPAMEAERRTVVGLVGYPNVGKSCTVNALLSAKKVSVSATPGKTKHFQTLLVPSVPVTLCDCPGLVMPSLVATKADMVLYGILPVDQLRDWLMPVAALRALIPTQQLESLYGIMIPKSQTESELSPHPLLNSYAYCRGLMTANGQPDGSRAARSILKDFVNGRLVYCVAPPGTDQDNFQSWKLNCAETVKSPPALTPIAARAIQDVKTEQLEDLNSSFFKASQLGAHSKGSTEAGRLHKGVMGVTSGNDPSSSQQQMNNEKPIGKPWKDHSHKRNKREKLRRVYRHHDI